MFTIKLLHGWRLWTAEMEDNESVYRLLNYFFRCFLLQFGAQFNSKVFSIAFATVKFKQGISV